MRILRILLMVFICWVLISCTGSIRIGRPYEPAKNADSVDADCRIYLRTDYSEIPPLPAVPKDRLLSSEELNIIQANYIVTLRNFISAEYRRLDDDYIRYVRKCLK